jgi:DNA-binding MarR family transcriptional regulator
VTRRPGQDDARRRVVALTEAGRRVIDQAFAEHLANERQLLDGLDAEDARRLERILATWLARFEPPR